jgi:hypothetical protein
MKDKRKGPIGRAAGLAEGVAATVRRMQREREPRLLVYDETGYARLVQPNGRGYERLLETAERMVALVDQAEAEAKPRRARRTDVGDGAKPPGAQGADAEPRRTERTEGAEESASGAGRPEDAKPRPAKRTKGGTKPRGSRTKGTGAAKPRRAPRAKDAEDAQPRGSRRAASESRRARAAGSADEPKKPRRARRSAREGDA